MIKKLFVVLIISVFFFTSCTSQSETKENPEEDPILQSAENIEIDAPYEFISADWNESTLSISVWFNQNSSDGTQFETYVKKVCNAYEPFLESNHITDYKITISHMFTDSDSEMNCLFYTSDCKSGNFMDKRGLDESTYSQIEDINNWEPRFLQLDDKEESSNHELSVELNGYWIRSAPGTDMDGVVLEINTALNAITSEIVYLPESAQALGFNVGEVKWIGEIDFNTGYIEITDHGYDNDGQRIYVQMQILLDESDPDSISVKSIENLENDVYSNQIYKRISEEDVQQYTSFSNLESKTTDTPEPIIVSEPDTAPESSKPVDKPSSKPAEENTVSLGKSNALSSAKNYLSFMAFSYEGLISQLEYEGYTTEEATYGADNCGADWNKQALKSAKNYLDTMAFSYTGLIEQLEYEQYTTEQATYGADNCGADWNEQAAKCAQSYMNTMSFSRDGLIDQLEYEGFTSSQAEYGAASVGY